MEWIAVEVKGRILRMWPNGGDEIRRTLDAGVTLESLVPEIEHTVSLQPHTRILATGVRAGAPLSVPCALAAPRHVPHVDPRLYLAPAVKQENPAGLIGYEVVRLAGLLAQDPKFDGVACLIGEQTVWAQISAEEIVSFQAAATVRLAGLLGATPSVGEGFEPTLSDIIARPQKLASKIASLEAARTLGLVSETEAASQLTGALVGAELAAMRPYWLGQRVALIGNARSTTVYEKALSAQGVVCDTYLGADLALKGLRPFATEPA
ncbi:2-dehydro-3-deoxygalactonokinase [Aliiroseovarius crassostreae]|uniref:2-dehydro-3-deoxygalactonokinase n=1 Tax=Aliiroseovarius crassostreae TaxID=154981 RepID=UPI002207A09B|nr:2-dehydro-3-deoxygalactonokinase [Aliiroseovarius crassostreae]UWQ05197.1 2-dehydro-3-deoxygalactonokinase [Aliiroseovarius crassostreae]